MEGVRKLWMLASQGGEIGDDWCVDFASRRKGVCVGGGIDGIWSVLQGLYGGDGAWFIQRDALCSKVPNKT